jgi:CheY-like chemotaxis protein
MSHVKGRILLVDDNEEFLDSTKDVLEEEDYQVVTAVGGEEAIRQVESSVFDVVLMDIKMPGLNGVDTFIEMKKRNRGVKVIMCTAYIVENLIRRAWEEGAYAVLNKPFEMDLLFRTIEMVGQSGNRGAILVADRDKQFCAELRSVLGSHGHRVLVSHDGRDALKRAEHYAFDILLLDINLPLVNGVEVHRRIRAVRPDTFITVLVGAGNEMHSEVQRKLREESGLTILVKPLDLNRLTDLMATMCEAKRLQKS